MKKTTADDVLALETRVMGLEEEMRGLGVKYTELLRDSATIISLQKELQRLMKARTERDERPIK